jgi:hypothetical protein
VNSVQSLQVAYFESCSADAGVPVDLSSSGGTGLRYDATSNQFVFNWQTKGFSAGCYSLVLMLDDTTVHRAVVSLK